MTRRRVVFVPEKGARWITPEYNGDKADFALRGWSLDGCEKNWDEIFSLFAQCKTYTDFIKANVTAQSYYHSCLENGIFETCHRLNWNEKLPSADEILYVGPGAV
jgi:hypothetical protein